MKHTLESLKSLLTSNMDTVSESTEFGHFFAVQFNASKEKGGRTVVIHVRENKVDVGSTSTAGNDFLGTADAYTRAAAFVRAIGLPLQS